jgi:hypothetical protein
VKQQQSERTSIRRTSAPPPPAASTDTITSTTTTTTASTTDAATAEAAAATVQEAAGKQEAKEQEGAETAEKQQEAGDDAGQGAAAGAAHADVPHYNKAHNYGEILRQEHHARAAAASVAEAAIARIRAGQHLHGQVSTHASVRGSSDVSLTHGTPHVLHGRQSSHTSVAGISGRRRLASVVDAQGSEAGGKAVSGVALLSQPTQLQALVQELDQTISQGSAQFSSSHRRTLLASTTDDTTTTTIATSDASPTAQEPRLAKEGRAQAQANTADVHEWAAKRIPKAIWRGSATGYLRGWSPLTASHPDNHKSHAARSLMNKRIYLSAMGRVYPWLDVGLVG